MSLSVLDTSALVAFLANEPGEAVVGAELNRGAAVSTLNVQELIAKIIRDGGTRADAVATIDDLALTVYDLTLELAVEAGAMIATTREAGLSHGDRACLALAKALGCPALTADRRWAEVSVGLGVQITLIR